MGKLCKDQLIKNLVPLFRDAGTDIDEAIKEAKSQLTAEEKKTKAEDLEKLFDSQIQTLQDRGCPEQIVEIFQNQRGQVLQKASEMSLGKGNILFLPVIPRTYRSPYDLMAMVRNNDKQGHNHLNPTAITDEFETPKDPYHIYGVEDGQALLNESPEKAINILKEQSRFSLTAAEVMALATHTNVLSRHYVWATGSRFGDSGGVPVLCLGEVRPVLDYDAVGDSCGHWGSPSCGSR